MINTEKQKQRGILRKLKQARRRKERILNRLSKINVKHVNVRKPIKEELQDIEVKISVLELKVSNFKKNNDNDKINGCSRCGRPSGNKCPVCNAKLLCNCCIQDFMNCGCLKKGGNK
jgi:DNA repair exonuclease SbcCD ATPase subunit